jgi:hypothetical protein
MLEVLNVRMFLPVDGRPQSKPSNLNSKPRDIDIGGSAKSDDWQKGEAGVVMAPLVDIYEL